MRRVASTRLVVGLEIHVELATWSKVFARAGNPAHPEFQGAEPNSLIDPVVLGLPGSLPVPNREAVELAMMMGLALGCSISPRSRFDRKCYFYPDLPKGYQISQLDQPLCVDGVVETPPLDSWGAPILDAPPMRVRVLRAHLEEDAGKLAHEAPGGRHIPHSIVDWNRAGAPLLEIVTHPDFDSAESAVDFARLVRNLARFLGVSQAILERGQMRFEPNINTHLTLDDGRTVATPIVEVKNLNSFRALAGAIDHEAREQPNRWLADGIEHGPGRKSTRGWDDARGVTVEQRRKEDAHDYRYHPDPDLPPLVVDEAWRARAAARVGETPLAKIARYSRQHGLSTRDGAQLTEDRGLCDYFEAVVREAEARGAGASAGRGSAVLILQSGAKRANERGVMPHQLGVEPARAGAIVALREAGSISAASADELLGACADDPGLDPESAARERGLLVVRDENALEAWCQAALQEHPRAADDVRAGKDAAIGRLVGAVMKRSGGAADAATVREKLLRTLRG